MGGYSMPPNAYTSLMRLTPACTASSATSYWKVSTEMSVCAILAVSEGRPESVGGGYAAAVADFLDDGHDDARKFVVWGHVCCPWTC